MTFFALAAKRAGTAASGLALNDVSTRGLVAAEAAEKNLKVVQDAYGRGAISYLNLLDAQNAALVSRLVAANAVYDCLIDFMNVQRAVSRFNVLETDEDNRAFIERLVTFVEQERKGP